MSRARNDGSLEVIAASFESYDADREPAMRPTPFQAFVRVMMGCDKFCTYCIVPSVRGPEQSRPPRSIEAEARVLADQGAKEITLLGQTVNSYHYREADGRTSRLSDLLERIHAIPGIERIKFITNFPNDMTDDLLQAVRDLPKVSRYIHVPAQSGCDQVLKRMKRMYTVSYYEEMLARIRGTIPGVAVSSDFIVGFCGEDEESFGRTVGLVERARFKNSFIFKYSPRDGTKADRLVCRRRSRAGQDGGATTSCWPFRRRSVWKTTAAGSAGPSRCSSREQARDGPPRRLAGRRPVDRAHGLRPDRRLRWAGAADRPVRPRGHRGRQRGDPFRPGRDLRADAESGQRPRRRERKLDGPGSRRARQSLDR